MGSLGSLPDLPNGKGTGDKQQEAYKSQGKVQQTGKAELKNELIYKKDLHKT